MLEKVEGRFLLSSYHSEVLARYALKNDWHQREFTKVLTISGKNPKRNKVEVLTANYPLEPGV